MILSSHLRCPAVRLTRKTVVCKNLNRRILFKTDPETLPRDRGSLVTNYQLLPQPQTVLPFFAQNEPTKEEVPSVSPFYSEVVLRARTSGVSNFTPCGV